MSRRWIIPIAVALIFGLGQGLPVNGEGDVTTNITVTNADATKQVDVVSSSPLESLLATAVARVTFNYGDASKTVTLVNTPAGFSALLGQIAARVAYNYSDASYALPLSFPKTIVNDTAPPQAPGQVFGAVVNGQLVLTWTSAEFTKATVVYGTQPGSYPNMVSESDFATQHSIVLPNLDSSGIYYLKITQTDLSGNSAASGEYQLIPKRFVYVPMVRR